MLAALAETENTVAYTLDEFLAQRQKRFVSSNGVVTPFRDIHFDAVLEPFKNGSAEEQYEVARLYLSGKYSPEIPKDYAEAIKYAQLSLDQGYIEAANLLALIYSSESDFKDVPKAISILRDAVATNQSAAAHYNLALVYKGEVGEEYIDVEKHIDLLFSAAELNSVEAILQLGVIAVGSNNVHDAYEYFSRAKELGSEKGALALEELMRQVNDFNRISVGIRGGEDEINTSENGSDSVDLVPSKLPEDNGQKNKNSKIEGVPEEEAYPVSESKLEQTEPVAPVFSVHATPQIIAERLLAARKAKGWTQLELANAMGLKSKRAVQNLENAREGVTLSSIRSAMEALEIKEL